METIEGNITEIDYNNKCFILQSGDWKTEYKIYWKPQHDSYMVKQKVGYYEKPTVDEVDGLLKLEDIRYNPRPENFPKLQKKGSGGKGYYGKSPEERKDIRLMACLKAAAETWQSPCIEDEKELLSFEDTCTRIAKAAVEMEKVLSGEAKG